MPNHPRLNCSLKPSTTELGRRMRERRLELGLSQVDLAHLSGKHCGDISNIETGLSRYVAPSTIEPIERVLEISLKEFCLTTVVEKEPNSPLGKFIFSRRCVLGLNKADLARRVGLGVKSVAHMEMHATSIAPSLIGVYAKALECSEEDFVAFKRKLNVPRIPDVLVQTKLGKRLQSRRLELGYTLGFVGNKVGVTKERIHQFEVRGSVPASRLKQLANILHLSYEELSPLNLHGQKVRKACLNHRKPCISDVSIARFAKLLRSLQSLGFRFQAVNDLGEVIEFNLT